MFSRIVLDAEQMVERVSGKVVGSEFHVLLRACFINGLLRKKRYIYIFNSLLLFFGSW